MRASVISLSKKLISTFFAATLAVGLLPATAFAENSTTDNDSTTSAVSSVFSPAGAVLAPHSDEAGIENNAQASDDDDSVFIPAGEIINQEIPLNVVAQSESPRSYFLAQTLETTRTVPMVSAQLPIDAGVADGVVEADAEASEKFGISNIIAAESTVVGSFEHCGITYAIEPGGESVAVVAADYAKLPEDLRAKQVIIIPGTASPDGIDFYSVTRIIDGAFVGFNEESADPSNTGGEALQDAKILNGEGSFAEKPGILAIGIPSSVERIEDNAFDGFETLQCIVVSEENLVFASYDGCLYDASFSQLRLIPEGRLGVVRIASSVMIDDSEVFSHCPSDVILVADADNAAFLERKNDALYANLLAIVGTGQEWNERPDDVLRGSVRTDLLSRSTKSAGLITVDANGGGIYGYNYVAYGTGGTSEWVEDIFGTSTIATESWDGFIQANNPDGSLYIYRDIDLGGGTYHRYLRYFLYNGIRSISFSSFPGGWAETEPGYVVGAYATKIYAVYPTSSFTLDKQGGMGGAVDITARVACDLPAVAPPTRAGYEFGGYWSGTNGTGSQYYNADGTSAKKWDSVTITTLYAKWTPATYSIAYDDNGGIISGKTKSYTFNSADFSLPSSGTKIGYTFAGWDVSGANGAGVTGAGTTDVMVKKGCYGNLTVTAKWTPVSYSITYDDNGGTFSGKTGSYNIEAADFSLPSSGTKIGYTFAGWDVSGSNGAGVTGTGTTNVVVKKGCYGDLTATAKWNLNTYNLSWETPHATPPDCAESFTVDDCPLAIGAATADAGYTFAGWSGPGITGGPKTFSLESGFLAGKGNGSTLTYVASMSPNEYMLVLHPNDGSPDGDAGEPVEQVVTYDATVGDASIPRRYGYVFSGYYAKETDGSKGERYFDANGSYVRDGGIWKGLSNIDLYASWILMGNIDVPINAPSAVSFVIDRATGLVGLPEDLPGEPVGSSVEGTLRSAMPEKVALASLELEALSDGEGNLYAEKLLGEGNPEECAMEVVFAPGAADSSSALVRFVSPSGLTEDATKWTFDLDSVPMIPAAKSVPAGSTGDTIVSDELGNLAEMGELPLTYALKLLDGFDMRKVPLEDATEAVARIVFTIDLTSLEHERF